MDLNGFNPCGGSMQKKQVGHAACNAKLVSGHTDTPRQI